MNGTTTERESEEQLVEAIIGVKIEDPTPGMAAKKKDVADELGIDTDYISAVKVADE